MFENQLKVGNFPVSDLIEKYGSPLFVYDDSILDRQITALK